MERDSVIHSTISSAASAWLRQNNMASPMSPLLGVRPRSVSSSLSRSLQRGRPAERLKSLKEVHPPPRCSGHLLFLQTAFLAALLVVVLFVAVIVRTVEVRIKRRRAPQGAVLKHPEVVCPPLGRCLALRGRSRKADVMTTPLPHTHTPKTDLVTLNTNLQDGVELPSVVHMGWTLVLKQKPEE